MKAFNANDLHTEIVIKGTEKGLYKVLFRSRKPIAQKFQNWVCEVIKEIRLKGIYKMQSEINKAIEEKNRIIIENFPSNVQCVYYGTIKNNKRCENFLLFILFYLWELWIILSISL